MNTKYIGKTYKNCSPSDAQQTTLADSTSLASTLKNSYATVFGSASSIFNSLSSKLNSIISNPSGLDPATLARINAGTLAHSAASEQQAQQAVNAKGATTSATPGVESGVNQMVRGQVFQHLETDRKMLSSIIPLFRMLNSVSRSGTRRSVKKKSTWCLLIRQQNCGYRQLRCRPRSFTSQCQQCCFHFVDGSCRWIG